MIRHVFMWQVASTSNKETVVDLLSRLSGELTMIESWELADHIGEPTENGDPWDGVLITDFAGWGELEAYSTHPVHQEIVNELLPMVKSRAVVDFERSANS